MIFRKFFYNGFNQDARCVVVHCNRLNLSLETIDSIIRQGKELGTHMYIYTGGEPLVRKDDLIKICEMHLDCEFLSFTNGTLIYEEFRQEMMRVKNFVPAISLDVPPHPRLPAEQAHFLYGLPE